MLRAAVVPPPSCQFSHGRVRGRFRARSQQPNLFAKPWNVACGEGKESLPARSERLKAGGVIRRGALALERLQNRVMTTAVQADAAHRRAARPLGPIPQPELGPQRQIEALPR